MATNDLPAESIRDNPSAVAVEQFEKRLDLYTKARLDVLMHPPVETDGEQGELDQLIDAMTAAGDYLIADGAPSGRAVLAKLEIATYHGPLLDTDEFDLIKADIMCLAGLDRSPTFLAPEWIANFERQGGKTMLIHREGEGRVPVLCAPTDSERANDLLSDLANHERAAVDEHLRKVLDPADYRQEVEA